MERELTILHLNDSQGYVELHHELFWSAAGSVYFKAERHGDIDLIGGESREGEHRA
jgi:hypothetical protein